MAIDVKGLSVNQILDMDVNKLDEKDLRKVATRLMSASNKRIKRLREMSGGKLSPAMQQMETRTPSGKFSVKGKNLNQLRHEISSMKGFLKGKTSSVTGWKRTKRLKKEQLEANLGYEITEKDEAKFWKTYHRLEESKGSALGTIYDSLQVMKAIHAKIRQRKGISQILDEIEPEMETMYKEGMDAEDNEAEIAVSDIFDS